MVRLTQNIFVLFWCVLLVLIRTCTKMTQNNLSFQRSENRMNEADSPVLCYFRYVSYLQVFDQNGELLRFNLKVGLSPSKKKILFASMTALQKWWKNAFYFILKALFVLKIFKFLSWACTKNGLIRKIRLISKFIASQHG